VRVALVTDQRSGVLAALAAFRANEQFALVVVAPQMLLEIVLVLQPALAVGTRALDAWPTLLEVQANVLLKDGLVLDLLTADMADIGRLAVLHADVDLHVVLRGETVERKERGYQGSWVLGNGSTYALCLGHWGQMNLRSLTGT